MVVELFTVYDKIAEEAGPVFQSKNRGVAIRAYLQLIGDTAQPLDYKLLAIGRFNTDLALLEGYNIPQEIDVEEALNE